MSTSEVRSPGSSATGREKLRIVTLAILVIGGVAGYIALQSDDGSSTRNMLPYQVLTRTLPIPEQQMYTAIRGALPALEAERARTSRWPEPVLLAANGVAPFSTASADQLEWQRFQQGATVTYFGSPADESLPAWLLMIQEPEPNTPPDPAPLDDEHHRLPDGTTLHIYLWMHRIGGRIAPGFVRKPENDGWIELFATPPNPVLSVRTS
jgi:hypothetical protein